MVAVKGDGACIVGVEPDRQHLPGGTGLCHRALPQSGPLNKDLKAKAMRMHRWAIMLVLRVNDGNLLASAASFGSQLAQERSLYLSVPA